jgi:hypothetical protein
VRQIITGKKWNVVVALVFKALDEQLAVLECAPTRYPCRNQLVHRGKDYPNPIVTIQPQHVLKRCQLIFFLTHKRPQFIQLAFGQMQSPKVISGNLGTMLTQLSHPLINRVFVHFQNASRSSNAVAFSQQLHPNS